MAKRTLGLILLAGYVSASGVQAAPIDCRVIVSGMKECSPYSNRLLVAKEIKYTPNKQKLIIQKELPVPHKNLHLKVISVEEMLNRYIKKFQPPKRFIGTKVSVPELIPVVKKKEQKQANRPPFKVGMAHEPIIKVVEGNQSIEVRLPKTVQHKQPSPTTKQEGVYTIQKGDTLGKIALMFGVKSADIMKYNGLKNKHMLRIGQKLKFPLEQEKIDAIASASYTVKEGDTLLGIAKKFGLDAKELATYNKIKNSAQLRKGKILKLPLPYVIAAQKAKKKAEAKKKLAKKKRNRFIRGFGKHRLRVTATAYSSHGNQTDSTPFLAAWNNRLRPGMKVIAISRDLLYRYGMRNGTRVRIGGLPGIYRVRDKMNKRFKKRIDIYMGTNRRKALRWGRRSVVIYW